jgi:hypothetical protein
MLANIAKVLLMPVLALLILILGPEIRNKILKHEQKGKGLNPLRNHSPLTYAGEDHLYCITVYFSLYGYYEPLGDIRSMINVKR